MNQLESPRLQRREWLSVVLYRGALVLACLSLVLGASFAFYCIAADDGQCSNLDMFRVPFWMFVCSIFVVCVFLHLYNARILWVIRLVCFAAALIFGFLLFWVDFEDIWIVYLTVFSQGFEGKLGAFALGMVFFSFSCVTSKEAFCFHFYEGYIISILSGVLMVSHLFGFLSLYVELVLLSCIGVLGCFLCTRKFSLPWRSDMCTIGK